MQSFRTNGGPAIDHLTLLSHTLVRLFSTRVKTATALARGGIKAFAARAADFDITVKTSAARARGGVKDFAARAAVGHHRTAVVLGEVCARGVWCVREFGRGIGGRSLPTHQCSNRTVACPFVVQNQYIQEYKKAAFSTEGVRPASSRSPRDDAGGSTMAAAERSDLPSFGGGAPQPQPGGGLCARCVVCA